MRLTLLSAALLASGLASAATPVDGWYASVFGGYTYFPGNVNMTSVGVLYNNANYIDGYNAGGRWGYQSNPIRYEIEYTYLSGNTKNFDANTIAQTGVSGFTSANMIMANIYYDTPEIMPSIVPFLGVGIGYSYLQSSLQSTGPNASTYFDATDNQFSYQGTVGLTYNFAENYALNVAYRYVATTNARSLGDNYQAQIANAGLSGSILLS